MFGLLLGFIGTFFSEIATTISKKKLETHHHFTMGAIGSFFSVALFTGVIIYKYYFTSFTPHLNPDSIVLLGIRLGAEILQTYWTILAIKYSDRSAFSILRILTIPLLLLVDILLGYQFSIYSYIGISIILLSFLFFGKSLELTNIWKNKFAILTAVNAVITISLFKYSIDRYGNSPEVDQLIIVTGILIFFLYQNYKKTGISAFEVIKNDKVFLVQAGVGALAGLFLTYTYVYLNASEATALKRAGEMFWAIIAGVLFFGEKNIIKKLLFAVCLAVGLFIMVL